MSFETILEICVVVFAFGLLNWIIIAHLFFNKRNDRDN